MSRLRQLTTVVRVAELRETVARSKVAAASAAVATARTVRCERLETLAGTRLDGADVASSARLLQWRAEAVRTAEQDVEAAAAFRLTAVADRVGAARHAKLLRRLNDRLLAEENSRWLVAEQRTADDSTAARHLRGRQP